MFVRGYDGFVLFLLTFWKFESSLLRARSNKSPKILFPASIDCFGRGPAKRRWTRNRSPDLLDQKNIGAASEFREKKGEVLGMSIQRLFNETVRLLGLFGLWRLKFSASGCCVIGSSKQSETCGNPALYRDHEFHCPNGKCSFLVARAVAWWLGTCSQACDSKIKLHLEPLQSFQIPSENGRKTWCHQLSGLENSRGRLHPFVQLG